MRGARRIRFTVLTLVAALLVHPGATDPLAAQSGDPALPPGGLPASRAESFSSEEPSTTEGALTLLLPVGAQGVAMGRAMTAQRGAETVFWNPAGIARLDQGRFTVFRGSHLAGEATAFSLLLTQQPLGVVAVSYQLLDLGDQDFTDENNNVLGTVSFRDHLAVISFATQLLPALDAGLNFKVFQSRITCRGQCAGAGVNGRTFAVDAGIQAAPLASLPLRLGAMVAHVGPDLQLINSAQADPLPTRLRVAVSYEVLAHFLETPDVELWLTGEVEDRWTELGSPVVYGGGELLVGREDLFFLWAGYGQGQTGQPAGAAAGLGLRYERFRMGIGKSMSGRNLSGESEPVHISFGVGF